MGRWQTRSLRFREQLQRNAVALISLFVAVWSLSYNTWRNEQSEFNRNQRQASFVLLIELGELQEFAFHAHYDQESDRDANLRTGWALALTTRDLAMVLKPPVPEAAQAMFDTWERHSSNLGSNDDSFTAIRDSVQRVRDETLALLKDLE